MGLRAPGDKIDYQLQGESYKGEVMSSATWVHDYWWVKRNNQTVLVAEKDIVTISPAGEIIEIQSAEETDKVKETKQTYIASLLGRSRIPSDKEIVKMVNKKFNGVLFTVRALGWYKHHFQKGDLKGQTKPGQILGKAAPHRRTGGWSRKGDAYNKPVEAAKKVAKKKVAKKKVAKKKVAKKKVAKKKVAKKKVAKKVAKKKVTA